MEKVKVIYLLNSPTKHGGANKSFLSMLNGLVRNEIEPLVILPKEGDICKTFKSKGIPYKIVSYRPCIYPFVNNLLGVLLFIPRIVITLFNNRLALRKLLSIARQYNPRLIHTNVGVIHLGYVLSKELNIPHIWHLREFQDLDFGMHPLFSKKRFIQKINSPINYIIANSKSVYDHFSIKEKGKVIYNGVFEKNQTQLILEKRKYFLFAGRLEKNKGILDLIEAYSKFKYKSEYRLFIAGDTHNLLFKKFLVTQTEELGIKEYVNFLGMRDDVDEIMSKALALIVPSANEAFGRITAEAMFMGCLVIGKKTGGTKEILENDNLGILYNNSQELVDSMNKLVETGIINYLPVIKKAQENAKKNYSIEQNIKNTYQVYTEILKGR